MKDETHERTQVFEGIVIAIRGSGINCMFTVRHMGTGAVGIERIFPLLSPWIRKMEVKKHGDVRRAKLYYLRGRQGRPPPASMRPRFIFDPPAPNKNSHKNRLGKIGEDLASEYLTSHHYTIIERNFQKRYGELDIIAIKDKDTYICRSEDKNRQKIWIAGRIGDPTKTARSQADCPVLQITPPRTPRPHAD